MGRYTDAIARIDQLFKEMSIEQVDAVRNAANAFRVTNIDPEVVAEIFSLTCELDPDQDDDSN